METPEDVRVPSAESNGRGTAEAVEEGVLSNLPRTRPQRTTERRLASREGRRPRAAATNGTAKAAAEQTRDAAPKRAAGSAKAKAPTGAKAAAGATASPKPKRATRATSAGRPRKTAAKARGQASPKAPRAAHAAAKGPTPGRAAPKRTPAEPEASAPRQGFESEPSRTTGPVQPPGGAELVSGAMEIVGELARAGVSAGERALKDLFSRLPH